MGLLIILLIAVLVIVGGGGFWYSGYGGSYFPGFIAILLFIVFIALLLRVF